MQRPIFSVIIPVHNEENHLVAAINSILNQTEQSFEIIIVLDNCTDKSIDIAKTYSTNKKINSYEVSKGSAAGTRNFGASLAQGDYLLFHDADCIADPTLLNNAAKYLEDFNVEGVATRTTNTPPKNWVQTAVAIQRGWRWENKQTRPTLIDETSGINVAIMNRRVFKSLGGFNEKIFYFEDNDLTKRFFKNGYTAIFGHDVIQYHNDPESLMESIGQCKNIAKGIRSRGGTTTKEVLMMLFAIIGLINLAPYLLLFLMSLIKSKDVIGSIYFTILWEIRTLAKIYYYLAI
jgi:glycosyltransferase involved in cell wall biosynthesis